MHAADPSEPGPGRRRASRPPKPPVLKGRIEAALFAAALAAALADLRAQLPPGYLQSEAQARVGVALPPVAGAMASIIRRASRRAWLLRMHALLLCRGVGCSRCPRATVLRRVCP